MVLEVSQDMYAHAYLWMKTSCLCVAATVEFPARRSRSSVCCYCASCSPWPYRTTLPLRYRLFNFSVCTIEEIPSNKDRGVFLHARTMVLELAWTYDSLSDCSLVKGEEDQRTSLAAMNSPVHESPLTFVYQEEQAHNDISTDHREGTLTRSTSCHRGRTPAIRVLFVRGNCAKLKIRSH